MTEMALRSPLVLGTLALLFVSPYARAHRPQKAEASWNGLDAARTSVPADGVQVLKARPTGRVRIAGGTFVMGSTEPQAARARDLCDREIGAAFCKGTEMVAVLRAEESAHPVTLSTFDMDRTEVTVDAYGRCVSAGACAPPDLSPTDARFSRPELPITHVRWDDAVAYCSWAGGRLPTEAEWEYAARGTEERIFPWGDLYNPHLANHGAWAADRSDATDGFLGLAPVGSFPDGATPLGLYDMAGNVAEWVADVMERDEHGLRVGYKDEAVIDPPPHTSGGSGGGYHILRGGSYEDAPIWLRTTSRDETSLPRSPWAGFRCAASTR